MWKPACPVTLSARGFKTTRRNSHCCAHECSALYHGDPWLGGGVAAHYLPSRSFLGEVGA